jgi:F-type H+-transporting ATPase subunit delta
LKRQQAVKRYAKMFFNTVGVDAVPKALDELVAVNAVMEKSREFRGLLENPLFTGEEREKVMKQASARLSLSESTVKFVLFLSEQMVIASLPELIRLATAMYLEKKKRAKATVVTSFDTGRKYDEALKVSLGKLTGKEVEIEYVVDPSLLGGIMVKVGSTMYDSSIKGQLRLLKDDLIKG